MTCSQFGAEVHRLWPWSIFIVFLGPSRAQSCMCCLRLLSRCTVELTSCHRDGIGSEPKMFANISEDLLNFIVKGFDPWFRHISGS